MATIVLRSSPEETKATLLAIKAFRERKAVEKMRLEFFRDHLAEACAAVNNRRAVLEECTAPKQCNCYLCEDCDCDGDECMSCEHFRTQLDTLVNNQLEACIVAKAGAIGDVSKRPDMVRRSRAEFLNTMVWEEARAGAGGGR